MAGTFNIQEKAMQNHLEAHVNFPVSQGHCFGFLVLFLFNNLQYIVYVLFGFFFLYFPKDVRFIKIPTVTVQLLPQFCSGVIPPLMILDDIPESEQEHSLYSASLQKTKQNLIQQWRHLVKVL